MKCDFCGKFISDEDRRYIVIRSDMYAADDEEKFILCKDCFWKLATIDRREGENG